MKVNLQFKIIGIITLISLIFFSSLGYIDVKRHSQILEESYIEKAESIARVLDASIKDIEELEDKSKLLSIINKNIWLDADILKISVSRPYQDDLITIVSNDQHMIGEFLDEDNIKSYRDNILISKFVVGKESGIKVLRVVSPVHAGGQVVGTYQIDLTLENIENRIKEEIVRTVLTTILMMFITIVLMYILLRFIIVKPISGVEKGIESITKGNLDYKVDVKSKDQIGKLASSFNKMAQDLKKYQKKLLVSEKKRSEGLKKEVKKRTKELEEKNKELEKFNKITTGRELKMVELKKEIEELKERLEEKPKYS